MLFVLDVVSSYLFQPFAELTVRRQHGLRARVSSDSGLVHVPVDPSTFAVYGRSGAVFDRSCVSRWPMAARFACEACDRAFRLGAADSTIVQSSRPNADSTG